MIHFWFLYSLIHLFSFNNIHHFFFIILILLYLFEYFLNSHFLLLINCWNFLFYFLIFFFSFEPINCRNSIMKFYFWNISVSMQHIKLSHFLISILINYFSINIFFGFPFFKCEHWISLNFLSKNSRLLILVMKNSILNF